MLDSDKRARAAVERKFMAWLDGLAAVVAVGVLSFERPLGRAALGLLSLLGVASIAAVLQLVSRRCGTIARAAAVLVLGVALATGLFWAPPLARGLAWGFVATRALHWVVQLLLFVAPPAPDPRSLQPPRGLLPRILQRVRAGLMSPRLLPWAAMSSGLCFGLMVLGAIPIPGFQLFYLFAIPGLLLAPVATLALIPAIVVLMLQGELGRVAQEESRVRPAPPPLLDADLSLLGLQPGASPREIRAAFHRLAFECHPDRAGKDPAAAERFQRLSEARARLLRSRRAAA